MICFSPIRFLLPAIALLSIAFNGFSQEISLKYFFAAANNNKAYLRWSMSAGNVCNGIDIFRSTDGINYNKIGEIFGVCGSNDSSQAFEYIDDSPIVNKTNYYRLTFGGRSHTHDASVYVLAENSIILYPNPTFNTSTLRFSNSSGESSTLNVYDLAGRLITTGNTSGNNYKLETSAWHTGLYILVLTLPNRVYTQKMCVIH